MRRTFFVALAIGMLVIGAMAATGLYLSAPTVLRVAVGPPGSEDVKLMAAAAQHLGREHASVRLRVVPADDEADAARKMEAGSVDLAVVRTDIALPARAETVVVMHRDIVALFTLPGRGVATIGDLKGKNVGLVRRAGANKRLLDLVLTHIDVPPSSVTTVPLDDPKEAGSALLYGRVDAVLAVGTINGRTITETLTSISSAGSGINPVVLPVPDPEAIAQRSPIYEPIEIVRGAFGGAVPRPPETVKTLGVTHRLVAATGLNDNTVAELTRQIFAMRPSVATEVPIANRISAPDYEKGASLPVHGGAAAYYEGEVESFLERNTDLIYLGAMALSVVGSAVAALASRAGSRKRAETLDTLGRLQRIVAAVREAPDEPALAALEQEADVILGQALDAAGRGMLDSAGVSAFSLGMDQTRGAIAERRRKLGIGPSGSEVAA